MKLLLSVRALLVGACWIGLRASDARSQFAPLPVEQLDSAGQRHSPAPLGTPGELKVDVEFAAADGRDAINPEDSLYPRDALRAAVVARAHVWLDSLAARPVHGLQLTAYGRLAVMGGREILAQQELTQRLVAPHLSIADRAFALYAGATAFTDREHPEWLPIAEHYLTQLTALGSPAEPWQFASRARLSLVYGDLGQPSQALAHALRAYALLPSLPFEDHFLAMNRALHLRVAQILLGKPGMPDGAARMHAVDSLIIAMACPPEHRIQLDSSILWRGQQMVRMVQDDSAFAFTLGRPGPPITVNVWINRVDSSLSDQRVDDGRIYLLDFFQPDYSPALASQLSLSRLQQRLGRVQVIGVASLTGHWGTMFADPQDEVQRWREFFVRDLKLTFPIAFWVKPKERHENGGLLPPRNPNIAAYHVPGGMGVVVIDQRGLVRQLFPGAIERDQEDDIVAFVTSLESEGVASHTTP